MSAYLSISSRDRVISSSGLDASFEFVVIVREFEGVGRADFLIEFMKGAWVEGDFYSLLNGQPMMMPAEVAHAKISGKFLAKKYLFALVAA